MNTSRSQLCTLLLSLAVGCSATSRPPATSNEPAMQGGTDGANDNGGSRDSGPRDSDVPAAKPPSAELDASSGVPRPEPDAMKPPAIGSACVAADFDVAGGDHNQLVPGQRFCLLGALYPGGYVSSNCRTDSDCPDDTRCDGENCRKPCEADTSCRAPMVCAMLDPFSSCQCTACAQNIRM